MSQTVEPTRTPQVRVDYCVARKTEDTYTIMAKPYKVPDTKELLEAGLHFGHQVRRWNPKMEQYIYDKRKSVHIIDLVKTYEALERTCDLLYKMASEGKTIIFVGTKKQIKEVLRGEAERSGAMYINERWLGGTLTNFRQIRKNMDKLREMEANLKEGKYDNYTKKERLDIQREIDKLEKMVGGIRNLKKVPDCLAIIDVRKEKTAVREASDCGIPVVALVDTNSDPTGVEYVIPGNDDSIRSTALILKTLADAVEAGYKKYGKVEDAQSDTEVEDDVKVDVTKIKSNMSYVELNESAKEAEEYEKRVEKEDEDGDAENKGLESLGLSTRAENALKKAGIDKVADLKGKGLEELKEIKGLGAKSAEEIVKKLKI